jgi:hypothetical protein
MSLVKALKDQKVTRKGPRCFICQLLDDLPKEDSDALVAALDDGTYTSAAIGRAIRSEGYTINDVTVIRHRKRDCAGK